jgi:hypothetical protein
MIATLLAVLLAQAPAKVRVCDKTDPTKCAAVDATGKVSISGTINAASSCRATAVGPTYTEGTDNFLSCDLAGTLRTTAGSGGAGGSSFNDGATDRQARVKDTDTGGGTHYTAEVILQKSASGGPVDFGTSTDPVRTDPTGTTIQPMSAASLPLPTGAATEATLLNVKTGTDKIPASPSTDRTTAAGPFSTRLSDGAAFYDATKTGQLPAALDGSGFLKTHEQGTAAISAASLPLPAGAATSAVQTDGTQKAIVRGGAKGATTAADVTSTANGADHQGLDVAVQGTVTVTGTVTTTPPTDATTNVTKFGGTNVSTGTGAGGLGIPRVTVSNDSNILATQSGTWTVQQGSAPWTTDMIRVNGTTLLTGNGATGLGSLRVTIASDNTAFTVNAAQSGTWNINNISGTISLPTGAATDRTTAAGPFSVRLSDGAAFYDARSIRLLTSADTVTVLQPTGTNLHMVCDSGCTPGGSFSDNTAFTAGTTAIGISGGEFNDTPLADVASGNAAAPRITKQRAFHVNLRDSLGNEVTSLGSSGKITDGDFGVNQATVLGPAQTPDNTDKALVVTLSPSTPINILNIGNGHSTVSVNNRTSTLQAPTIKTQIVDPNGRPATVLGPRQIPNGTENAQVFVQSPLPIPTCPKNAAVSQTASSTTIPGSAGKTTYICKVFLVSTTAQSISITEGTGTTCGTGALALAGHTTVANGMGLAANGGWTEGNGVGIVYTAQKLGDDVCVLQSGAGNVAGSISYVQF